MTDHGLEEVSEVGHWSVLCSMEWTVRMSRSCGRLLAHHGRPLQRLVSQKDVMNETLARWKLPEETTKSALASSGYKRFPLPFTGPVARTAQRENQSEEERRCSCAWPGKEEKESFTGHLLSLPLWHSKE